MEQAENTQEPVFDPRVKELYLNFIDNLITIADRVAERPLRAPAQGIILQLEAGYAGSFLRKQREIVESM